MGFLTIENHKGFPHYIYNDTPEFSDIHAQLKYLEQEKRRVNEGWEGLSSLMYFHLAKIKIKNEKGKIVPPDYIDTDVKLMNDFLWCINYKDEIDKETKEIRDGWDLDIVKRRRVHFSTIFGGTVPAWLGVAEKYKGCTYPITSCDTTRLNLLVNNCLKPAVNSAVNEGYIPENYFSNPEFMNFSSKSGKRDDSQTTIYFLDTSKDDRAAAKAEGSGNVAALIDERFLHQRELKVKLSFEATLYQGTKKFGILVSGGSTNAFNQMAIRNLKESLKVSEGDKKKIEFIAGWDGLEYDKITGITNKQSGIDWIIKQRDKFRKSNNWEKLANLIKTYPLTIEELIGSVEGENFTPNVRENLNKGKIYAFNHEPLEVNLVNHNGRVFTDNVPLKEPDLSFPEKLKGIQRKFPYRIYETYNPDHVYGTHGDPIDFMGSNPVGSFFCQAVKDFTDNKYVCDMQFRTTNPELGYNLWYNLMLYYHIKPSMCLMEKNRLGSLLSMCKLKGTLNLLAFDPDKKQRTSDDDRGYHKDMNTINKLLGYTKMYLENNIIPFDDFNESFPNYDTETDYGQKKKKTDIVDAVMGCEYLHQTLHVNKQEPEEYKPKTIIVMERNSQGFMTERTINV